MLAWFSSLRLGISYMETQLDFLGDLRRTHTCGQLRAADAGSRALLMGWVHRHRDLGGVIFIHLRDRDGVTQIAIHADADEAAHRRAEQVRPEYVIAVEGAVALRSADTVNPSLETGEVELFAEKIWILNESRTPPAHAAQHHPTLEDLLRRARMPLRYGLPRNRDAFHDPLHAGRRARLPGAQPRAAGQFLCAAAIAANLQATADGLRLRQILPDRALLPR